MNKNNLIPVILNLFTAVGGHFYNRRHDRVLLILSLSFVAVLLYAVSMLAYFFASGGITLPLHFGLASHFYLVYILFVVVILLLSMFLAYKDSRKPSGEIKPINSISGKFSAAILTFFGFMFVLVQAYSALVYALNFNRTEVVGSADYKSKKHSFAKYSSDNFFLNGYALKRYDNSMRDKSLPAPPSGSAELTGHILLDDAPVKGFAFDLVLDGKYRARNVTTNYQGEFSIPVRPGVWHVDYIHPKSWTNEPKEKQFLILTGREDMLHGNSYNDYKNMAYEKGLPINVTAKGQSKPLKFIIKEQLNLLDPSGKKQPATKANYKIDWAAYPNAKEYLVKINSVTHKGRTTSYHPIRSIKVAGVTELSLSQLPSIKNKGVPAEYKVTVYAFGEQGRFLTKSDNLFDKNTFILTDGNRLVPDDFDVAPDMPSVKYSPHDIEEMMGNENRIDAVEVLIDEGLLTEAEKLLSKIKGKTKPGTKEAAMGNLYAAKKQCKEAKRFFDEARKQGKDVCLPKNYLDRCLGKQ